MSQAYRKIFLYHLDSQFMMNPKSSLGQNVIFSFGRDCLQLTVNGPKNVKTAIYS